MSIQSIIITNVEKLVQQMVPTITQIVEKTGIQNIGQPNMQMPSTCLLQNDLQDILKLRNSLINKLNTTSKIIESLSKTLNPLSTIVDVTSKTLQTIRTARIVANVGLSLLQPPTIVPGSIPATINNIKDLEELLKPQIGIAKNTISSITTALDYANSVIFKLLEILKGIDQYLAGCNIQLPSSPAINSYIAQVDQQYTNIQNNLNNPNNPNNPNNQDNLEVYNGFTLGIVEEPYTPTVNRRKAVAKNSQGIILLSTPLTFSTDNQTLLTAIKLIINSNDLKAN
jgi:hypothetical protein